MRNLFWLMTWLAANSLFAETKMIPVIEHNGQAHVSAIQLERDAGIAVKTLPGQKQIVVCGGDRCALVKEFVSERGDLLVRVEALAIALDAHAVFDQARRNVGFEFTGRSAPAQPIGRVGQLAPDFRLTKLDGTSVALSDFRGKRVLINSWASW